MNKELIKNIFNFIVLNPLITEEEIKEKIIIESDHSMVTITEWFDSIYLGLYESMVIDKPTFSAMKNKIINHVSISIDKVLEVLAVHFKDHPLQYELDIKLAEINEQIKTTELLPDKIMDMNHEKFMKLNELTNQREFLERK